MTDEFENQYGLGAINAQYAYARGHTGDGVLVSVMDTRFNTDHANLSGVFVEGYNVVSDDTVVDSGCTGPTNPCLHGTHVAGIIAGNKTDVDTGMHGVAYGAQIKPIPFLEIGITTGQQQVDAFENASGVDSGTGQQIVAMNNSWGAVAGFHGSTYNSKYFKVPNETTITNLDLVYLGSAAAADNNTILVFAAGNDGWNNETGIVDLFDSTDSSVRSGTPLPVKLLLSPRPISQVPTVSILRQQCRPMRRIIHPMSSMKLKTNICGLSLSPLMITTPSPISAMPAGLPKATASRPG